METDGLVIPPVGRGRCRPPEVISKSTTNNEREAGAGDLQETARRLKTEIALCESTLEECSLCSVNRVSSSLKTVYFKSEVTPKMEILAQWLSVDLGFLGLQQPRK